MKKDTTFVPKITHKGQVSAAHMSFYLRMRGLENKAKARAQVSATKFANSNEKHLRNQAYIAEGEAQGLKEVLRVYGGKDSSIRELPKGRLRTALNAISQGIEEMQNDLTVQISEQSYKALTMPETSPKHAQTQQKVLKLHGRLRGAQAAQEEFETCYLNFF